MASDDEDLCHSINDDLRMADMHADDENGLDVDWEELFGNAADPIEVADGDDGAAAAAAAGDGAATAAAGDGAAAAAAACDGAAIAVAGGQRKRKLNSYA